MKLFVVFLVAGFAASCSSTTASVDAENQLTTAEVDDGWFLLFNGENLDGWRGFRKASVPDGWAVRDGAIARVGSGGDLITDREFGNFVLELEWKVAEGANSGIFYGVDEDHDHVWQTGPEMQVLDNSRHRDGANALTSAGANYALHAPEIDVTRPVGEWNHVRLEVNGNLVRHSMNGALMFEFERWTDDWNALVEASKFRSMPDYGKNARGHIALQDHGDPVWYRNIRIREL